MMMMEMEQLTAESESTAYADDAVHRMKCQQAAIQDVRAVSLEFQTNMRIVIEEICQLFIELSMVEAEIADEDAEGNIQID